MSDDLRRRVTIEGGCTPQGNVQLTFDENPNGLPVVWLRVTLDGVRDYRAVPLKKEAVEKLIAELYTFYKVM